LPSSNTTAQPDLVDVRGPRFAAWVTTAVLVLALAVSAASAPAAAVILAGQAVIFAIGAVIHTAGSSPPSSRPGWGRCRTANRPHR
jgi:hypothetical protein